MLQLNLDIVSIKSHIGLTLLLYTAANRDSIDDDDYVVYFDKYMSDVQDLINIHFNSNSTKSIPYIFEHSKTVTDWPNSIEITSQNCKHRSGFFLGPVCTYDTSWCNVYDHFSLKYVGETCSEECGVNFGDRQVSESDFCTDPCNWEKVCKPTAIEASQNITKSLESTRNHIQEAKTLQEDILNKMKIVACDCELAGTDYCDYDTTGECVCLPNVTGDKCDTCKEGFYDITTSCNSTLISGPQDVGGKCPSSIQTYQETCCCGNSCCWDNCRWDNPPDDCLNTIPNSKWIWNEELGYYQAVQSSKLLSGPQDVGGICPNPDSSYSYMDTNCCCGNADWDQFVENLDNKFGKETIRCCWNECYGKIVPAYDNVEDYLTAPPDDCLSGVPNSEWVLNEAMGYYQAVQLWD